LVFLQVFCTRYVCWYTPNLNTPIPLRAKILHFCMAWFPVGLMIYGVTLVRASKTCKKTNPGLYDFTKWYTWFCLTCYVVFTIFGAIVLSVFFFLVNSGLINTAEAASQEAFDALPLVPMDPNGSPLNEDANATALRRSAAYAARSSTQKSR